MLLAKLNDQCAEPFGLEDQGVRVGVRQGPSTVVRPGRVGGDSVIAAVHTGERSLGDVNRQHVNEVLRYSMLRDAGEDARVDPAEDDVGPRFTWP